MQLNVSNWVSGQVIASIFVKWVGYHEMINLKVIARNTWLFSLNKWWNELLMFQLDYAYHDFYDIHLNTITIIGSGDYTDLLWWNDIKSSYANWPLELGITGPYKYVRNHIYWGLKNNIGTWSKNDLKNLWGNIVFLILC